MHSVSEMVVTKGKLLYSAKHFKMFSIFREFDFCCSGSWEMKIWFCNGHLVEMFKENFMATFDIVISQ